MERILSHFHRRHHLKSDDSYVVCHCVDIKKTLTATVWSERANSQNKYFHIHFPPLVSHVIHSYRCESINTKLTLTVMCFCFISRLIYCIINDSRCPLVNSPDFICLKHTAVLSNQLSIGYYLTNTFQTR